MDPMISALILIIVVGVLVWLAVTYIPMADPFPRILIGVAVIGTVLWLLCHFDLFCLGSHMK